MRAMSGAGSSRRDRPFHRQMRGPQDVEAVDLGHRGMRDRDLRRGEKRLAQHLAPFGASFWSRSIRRDAPLVEDHGRRRHRPGNRTAPDLVHARDTNKPAARARLHARDRGWSWIMQMPRGFCKNAKKRGAPLPRAAPTGSVEAVSVQTMVAIDRAMASAHANGTGGWQRGETVIVSFQAAPGIACAMRALDPADTGKLDASALPGAGVMTARYGATRRLIPAIVMPGVGRAVIPFIARDDRRADPDAFVSQWPRPRGRAPRPRPRRRRFRHGLGPRRELR